MKEPTVIDMTDEKNRVPSTVTHEVITLHDRENRFRVISELLMIRNPRSAVIFSDRKIDVRANKTTNNNKQQQQQQKNLF